MTKKLTAKQRREAALRDAVTERLKDILAGAFGPYIVSQLTDVTDDECSVSSLGTDVFSRFIGGVRNAWGVAEENRNDYPWNVNALENWDKPLPEIAEWLCGFDATVQAMKGRV